MEKLLKINTMFAFIFDGDEGERLCGVTINGQLTPLVGTIPERIEVLRPLAQYYADLEGKPVKLCVFNERVEMEVINPKIHKEQ